MAGRARLGSNQTQVDSSQRALMLQASANSQRSGRGNRRVGHVGFAEAFIIRARCNKIRLSLVAPEPLPAAMPLY